MIDNKANPLAHALNFCTLIIGLPHEDQCSAQSCGLNEIIKYLLPIKSRSDSRRGTVCNQKHTKKQKGSQFQHDFFKSEPSICYDKWIKQLNE